MGEYIEEGMTCWERILREISEWRKEWGEVSGFDVNILLNSKSPKIITQQSTKMMGERRRDCWKKRREKGGGMESEEGQGGEGERGERRKILGLMFAGSS